MSATLDPKITEILDALNSGYGSLAFVMTMSHGVAVQAKQKTRKVGPLLLPPDGGSVSDTLRQIADLLDTATEGEAL